jgi:hypothetical protein
MHTFEKKQISSVTINLELNRIRASGMKFSQRTYLFNVLLEKIVLLYLFQCSIYFSLSLNNNFIHICVVCCTICSTVLQLTRGTQRFVRFLQLKVLKLKQIFRNLSYL